MRLASRIGRAVVVVAAVAALGMLGCRGRAAGAGRAGTGSKVEASFDSAGVKIAYVEAGRGETVVLVHGLYSSAWMNWEMPGTFDLLAREFHVVALDLRGHGASDKPTAEEAYGQPMVEDVVRLMDHLKVQKAHLVGYSLGGIVVMKMVADHPERVWSANLGGMGWLKEGSIFQMAFEAMNGRGGIGNTPPACAHGIGRLALTEAQVKGIKVPVKVEGGDRDPCRAMYVEPLMKVRPDIGVTTIAGAGHLNCIVKEDYKNGVKGWLEAQGKAGTRPGP